MTLTLVTGMAAAYGYGRWGVYYLTAGIWASVFLGMTSLILKAMLERRPLLGLALVVGKFAWLGAIFLVFVHWNRGGAGGRVLDTALIAGVTTPLLVILLRAVGGALEGGPGNVKTRTEGKR